MFHVIILSTNLKNVSVIFSSTDTTAKIKFFSGLKNLIREPRR